VVDLITFGCPLDQLYARRLPEQFAWAGDLGAHPTRFVHGVTGSWVNFVGSADLIGGTIFHDLPHGEWSHHPGARYTDYDSRPWREEIQVEGGHGAYWKNADVFRSLATLAV
jgi:hypothetical protein